MTEPTEPARNIRLVLEYDGTDFAGWQRQPPPLRTVQQVVEDAIAEMTGVVTLLRGAGRTDAGVHALGQVANFRTAKDIPATGLLRGLNTLLPEDISIVECDEVSPEFDARYSARGKRYIYRIINREPRSPTRRRNMWHVWRPLDVDRMAHAASLLVGRHDFSAFQASDCGRENPVRTIRRLEITTHHPGVIAITVEADAFLKHMVRAIAGTLMEVGVGRRTIDGVRTALGSLDRGQAGRTAPAHGLTLDAVFYPAEI